MSPGGDGLELRARGRIAELDTGTRAALLERQPMDDPGVGTAVGQQFSAALAGTTSVEQALQNAQRLTEREMKRGGYIK